MAVTQQPGNTVSARLRMRALLTFAVAMGIASALCGCTTSLSEYIRNGYKVGPNFVEPPAPLPQNWIDEHNPRVHQGDPNLAAWWDVFDDPILNGLVQNSYSRNLTVRAAAYQIQQAQAQRQIAVGQFFPQTQALNSQYTRQEVSGNLGSSDPGANRFFTNVSTSFNASWEIDFWGLFRRNLESADASLDKSVQDYDELVVLLLANVATRYVELRTLQKRLELARRNVAMQEPLVEQYGKRYNSGVANSIPGYFQLKANLENTRALIPPLESALRLANNQLCTLLGMPVRDLLPELGDGNFIDAAGNRTGVRIPRPKDESVVVGIPGALLLRRPDVQSALQQLRMQSAQIGIAEAEMYPHININGSIGLSANSIPRLFNSRSWAGNIGPSLSWNILNYGRLLGNVRVQDALFQQYVAQYQNTVLNANEDAEDAMVAYLESLERAKFLHESADDAARVSAYLIKQSNAGFLPPGATDTSAFINQLFTTINFQVSQQDAAAQAEGNVALNLILLYRAMGGGWQIRLQQGCRPSVSNGSDVLPVTSPQTLPAPKPQPDNELPVPRRLP
jgi:NodT family efflux transporter outer membrane factor (OMF) lipoprotein